MSSWKKRKECDGTALSSSAGHDKSRRQGAAERARKRVADVLQRVVYEEKYRVKYNYGDGPEILAHGYRQLLRDTKDDDPDTSPAVFVSYLTEAYCIARDVLRKQRFYATAAGAANMQYLDSLGTWINSSAEGELRDAAKEAARTAPSSKYRFNGEAASLRHAHLLSTTTTTTCNQRLGLVSSSAVMPSNGPRAPGMMLLPPRPSVSSQSSLSTVSSTAAPPLTALTRLPTAKPVPGIPPPAPLPTPDDVPSGGATTAAGGQAQARSPKSNTPVELPPNYTAVLEVDVKLSPWSETQRETLTQPSANTWQRVKMVAHSRDNSQAKDIWERDGESAMTLHTMHQLGWAAHEELDQSGPPSVIITCTSKIEPSSRLVPTTEPKRVVYWARFRGFVFVLIHKERELVPDWSPSSTVHTVLYGYSRSRDWVEDKAFRDFSKMAELTLMVEPVGLLFEVRERYSNHYVPEPPAGCQETIHCQLDGTFTLLYVYPWAADLLNTLIGDSAIKLRFRSTTLTSEQLQDALTALKNSGYKVLSKLPPVSYPPLLSSTYRRPIPADISDVIKYAQHGMNKHEFRCLDRRVLILGKCPSSYSHRCQHLVLPVCKPITNTSMSSKGRPRETQGDRVKRLVDNMQQCIRRYGFQAGSMPASWKALQRSVYALAAPEATGRFEDTFKDLCSTVRHDRLVEYSHALVDHYFDQTDR